MVSFTDSARTKVRTIGAYLKRPALRIVAAEGASPLAPDYEFLLVEEEDAGPEDTVFEADGVTVILDGTSAARLRGWMVDYAETGFAVRLPHFTPEEGSPEGELAERVRRVIDERINPGVAAHGGKITLVAIRDNIVYIEMGGGCQGCALSRMTLRQGVERMIRQAVPEIAGVQDVTDHSRGSNPYYRG